MRDKFPTNTKSFLSLAVHRLESNPLLGFYLYFALTIFWFVFAPDAFGAGTTGGPSGGSGGSGGAKFDDSAIVGAICDLKYLMEGGFGAMLVMVSGVSAIVAGAFGMYRGATSFIVVVIASTTLYSYTTLWFTPVSCPEPSSELIAGSRLLFGKVCILIRFLDGHFGALVMVCSGLVVIVSVAIGGYKAGYSLLFVGCGVFVIHSVIAGFFGVDPALVCYKQDKEMAETVDDAYGLDDFDEMGDVGIYDYDDYGRPINNGNYPPAGGNTPGSGSSGSGSSGSGASGSNSTPPSNNDETEDVGIYDDITTADASALTPSEVDSLISGNPSSSSTDGALAFAPGNTSSGGSIGGGSVPISGTMPSSFPPDLSVPLGDLFTRSAQEPGATSILPDFSEVMSGVGGAIVYHPEAEVAYNAFSVLSTQVDPDSPEGESIARVGAGLAAAAMNPNFSLQDKKDILEWALQAGEEIAANDFYSGKFIDATTATLNYLGGSVIGDDTPVRNTTNGGPADSPGSSPSGAWTPPAGEVVATGGSSSGSSTSSSSWTPPPGEPVEADISTSTPPPGAWTPPAGEVVEHTS